MDIYYSPEKYGLEIVAVADDPDASYSFDMFVVWKDATGKLFWGQDAGCSCPTPFEDQGVDNLTTGEYVELTRDVLEWADHFYDDRTKAEAKVEAHRVLREAGAMLPAASREPVYLDPGDI